MTERPAQGVPLREARRRRARKDEGASAGDSDGRPTIKLVGGELPRIVNECLAALKLRPGDLYQRAGVISHAVLMPIPAADGRGTHGYRILPVENAHLVEQLMLAARFERFDGRRKRDVATDCPPRVGETLRARNAYPELRPLMRAISTPTLRADGSLLIEPGYDPASGLLYLAPIVGMPAIPDQPTRADAVNALRFLADLIETFPFAAPIDRSVALSGILTALVRASLPSAPLHAISATAPGTGKSMLVDLISIIATGREAGVIAQGRSDEESEKRLGSALLAGDAIINIDNCEWHLGGALLCQALTQSSLRIRVLGLSLNLEVSGSSAIFATGNGLVLTGDLARRALFCELDAGVERPELRVFKVDAIARAKSERRALVAAALTILRARVVSGWTSAPPPLGSFAAWSWMVRDSLIWLGEPDPAQSMSRIRERDPRLGALTEILDRWEATIGERRLSVAKVIEAALDREPSSDSHGRLLAPEFRDALLLVAGDRNLINPRRLGKWLSAHAGRIVAGRRIVADGNHAGATLWRLDLIERES